MRTQHEGQSVRALSSNHRSRRLRRSVPRPAPTLPPHRIRPRLDHSGRVVPPPETFTAAFRRRGGRPAQQLRTYHPYRGTRPCAARPEGVEHASTLATPKSSDRRSRCGASDRRTDRHPARLRRDGPAAVHRHQQLRPRRRDLHLRDGPQSEHRAAGVRRLRRYLAGVLVPRVDPARPAQPGRAGRVDRRTGQRREQGDHVAAQPFRRPDLRVDGRQAAVLPDHQRSRRTGVVGGHRPQPRHLVRLGRVRPCR